MILTKVRLHQLSSRNAENQKINQKFKSLIAVQKNQLRHQTIEDQMED